MSDAMMSTIVLSGGSVEYSLDEAAVPIEELINSLQDALDDGAEYVVMLSGNYRGPAWMSVGAEWSWAGDES